jgi:hypothetical protein
MKTIGRFGHYRTVLRSHFADGSGQGRNTQLATDAHRLFDHGQSDENEMEDNPHLPARSRNRGGLVIYFQMPTRSLTEKGKCNAGRWRREWDPNVDCG